MKRFKSFGIVVSLAVLASLVGCATQKFEAIDKPITIGDKTYVAVITERVNPWGTNAVTLNLVESEHKVVEQQRPQSSVSALPPTPMQQPCPPPTYYVPEPRHDPRPQMMQPAPMAAAPHPQRPAPTCEPQQRRPVPDAPVVIYCQVQQVPAMRPALREQMRVETRVELVNSRVVVTNNQGSKGWINGAFEDAIGDGLIGGGIAGAGCLLKPAHITGGAGGSASSVATGIGTGTGVASSN